MVPHPRTRSSHCRDRLHGCPCRTRTVVREEHIILLQKSQMPEFTDIGANAPANRGNFLSFARRGSRLASPAIQFGLTLLAPGEASGIVMLRISTPEQWT